MEHRIFLMVSSVLIRAMRLCSLKSRGLVFEYRTDASVTWTAHPFLRDRFRTLLSCPPEKVFKVVAAELGTGLEKHPATMPSDPSVLDCCERPIEAAPMNAGALTLVDYVLPEVPIRQFVLTMPFPLRFFLAFDGKLLGQVLCVFTDTVAANYRKRMADRGIVDGQYGAVTVIQRANSDLRCNPHVHAMFLDGLHAPDHDGKGFMFHPAPAPTQADVEAIVERASKRILRVLQRRGVITLVTAPGDGEVTVVTEETIGD